MINLKILRGKRLSWIIQGTQCNHKDLYFKKKGAGNQGVKEDMMIEAEVEEKAVLNVSHEQRNEDNLLETEKGKE